MKDKSETSHIFKNFHTIIQTQFSTKIQILRSDRARDFFNYVLGNFLTSQGIIHQSSCVDTLQQNGVSERKTVIYLRLLVPCYSQTMFLAVSGAMMSSLQHSGSIVYPPAS